jgi:CRP-like cAMP-binding protein
MAEERERVPRRSIAQAEDETDSQESQEAKAGEQGQDPEDEEEASSSDADWLNDSETDLGFWFDDDDDGELDGDAVDWDEGGDEAEEVSLLSGTASSIERRMTEQSSLIALSEFGLAEGSVHVVGDTEENRLDVAGLLARVVPTSPLLALLDSDWLRGLGELGKLVRIPAGQVFHEEGQEGDSLLLLLGGGMSVEVFDKERGESVRIATLRPGDFYGEAALLSSAIRNATLRAVSDSVGIELESEAVLTLVEHQPSVIKLLMRFFRARMVGAVMITSPLFHSCTAAQRRDLISHFRLREVAPDTLVVRAGDSVDGLFLVLDGELSVLGPDDNALWRLGRGDVFGERSLLDGFPATTSLRAEQRSWLLRMPRADFLEAICRHPHILEHVSALAELQRNGGGAAESSF